MQRHDTLHHLRHAAHYYSVCARDDHGNGIPNGNKNTPTWEWEWEGVGINADGNGNDLYSHGKIHTDFVTFSTQSHAEITLRLLLGRDFCTVAPFHYS